jgi:hypothetical protein
MAADRRLERLQRPNAVAPTSGALRVVRGTAVGTTAMSLAAAGHVAGGGSLPPATAAILLGLTVAGSVALSGRRWTFSALATVLLGVQLVCHVALAGPATAANLTNHSHAAHGATPSMLIAHVLAALVTAVVLRRGESWCWRLVALLARPAQVARLFSTRPALKPVARLLPAADGAPALLRSLLLADAQPRRGPPALLAR